MNTPTPRMWRVAPPEPRPSRPDDSYDVLDHDDNTVAANLIYGDAAAIVQAHNDTVPPLAEDTHTDVTEQAARIIYASLHTINDPDFDELSGAVRDDYLLAAVALGEDRLLATAPTTTERPCKHGDALYRKFDGGRSAILCDRCNRILGYMPPDTAPTTTVTTQQLNAVADALWGQTVGLAKSVMREAVADAFTAAGVAVTDWTEADQ